MDNKVYVFANSLTVEPSSHVSDTEHLDKILVDSAIADIAAICVICEKHTPMNSRDYWAPGGVFVCDKCKAAILHIRKLLEDGESMT